MYSELRGTTEGYNVLQILDGMEEFRSSLYCGTGVPKLSLPPLWGKHEDVRLHKLTSLIETELWKV
jgi:hypothetical protein